METRAYLTHDNETTLRVTVHENCTIYSDGTAVSDQSWTFPLADDGTWHLFGSQSDEPFENADRVLIEHAWTREGRWVVGDVVTGTYARVSRVLHALQGDRPVTARSLTRD